MGAVTDRELLVQFVVWRLRVCDLPTDVLAAAERLARVTPKPDLYSGPTEAPYRVTGIPGDDDRPMVTFMCDRPGLAATVETVWDQCPSLLLVQRTMPRRAERSPYAAQPPMPRPPGDRGKPR